jgi:carbon monoxide dehydrogenase subunit G
MVSRFKLFYSHLSCIFWAYLGRAQQKQGKERKHHLFLRQGGGSTDTNTHGAAKVQISPEGKPSTPAWFGEVAAVAHILAHLGRLEAIQQQVRFARARFVASLDTVCLAVSSLSIHINCQRFPRLFDHVCTTAPLFLILLLEVISLHISWVSTRPREISRTEYRG